VWEPSCGDCCQLRTMWNAEMWNVGCGMWWLTGEQRRLGGSQPKIEAAQTKRSRPVWEAGRGCVGLTKSRRPCFDALIGSAGTRLVSSVAGRDDATKDGPAIARPLLQEPGNWESRGSSSFAKHLVRTGKSAVLPYFDSRSVELSPALSVGQGFE
jgi:hypothetical protein